MTLRVCDHCWRDCVDMCCVEEKYLANYAAFYADCEHEVLPVTSGYRLTLVYNLVHAGEGITPHNNTNRT